jgi:hypothetical protein
MLLCINLEWKLNPHVKSFLSMELDGSDVSALGESSVVKNNCQIFITT